MEKGKKVEMANGCPEERGKRLCFGAAHGIFGAAQRLVSDVIFACLPRACWVK